VSETSGGAVFKSIYEVSKLLKREFEEQSRAHGLSLPQWRVIHQLAQVDGVSQVSLAASIDVTPMTMSGIIERLEARGLVERVADPGDSRAKLVRSTAQSRAMAAEGFAIRNVILENALAGFSDAERIALRELLQRVQSNLSAQSAETKESA